MKGVLFTEFLELVESAFGLEVLDQVLLQAEPKLENGGAYTSVGTYSHTELLVLVETLADVADVELGPVLDVYAEKLMANFYKTYPSFFEGHTELESFLLHVESQMHAGVRKIYADANPPTLDVTRVKEGGLIVRYRSHRPLTVVVGPLLMAAAKHYGAKIELERLDEGQLANQIDLKVRVS